MNILNKTWPHIPIPKIKNIKIFEIDQYKSIIAIESLVGVLINNDTIIPFLGKTETIAKFPSVTVDSGSIKYICNGAKVLRPGIVKFDDFDKNEIVVVKDEKFSKYLAAGIALEGSEGVKIMEKGYVVNNLHYVGDKVWDAYKEISFRL
ncbi:MAG: RNA-binding protein [Thermoproteota archaeon]|nr:RNA-binding protein [Thermoproteota archaeon]